jgi:hypothetical protein
MHKYNRFVTLKNRSWSVGTPKVGKVSVMVYDLVDVRGILVRNDWEFTFRPETGDLKTQIEARLGS